MNFHSDIFKDSTIWHENRDSQGKNQRVAVFRNYVSSPSKEFRSTLGAVPSQKNSATPRCHPLISSFQPSTQSQMNCFLRSLVQVLFR